MFFFVLFTLILKIFFNFIGTVDDGTTFESFKIILKIRENRKKKHLSQ